MRHEHLVVTVDSGTKASIEEHLDPGETVEAWVADAIDAKLAREEAEGKEKAKGKEGAKEKRGAESGEEREGPQSTEAIRADGDETELTGEAVRTGDDATSDDETDAESDDAEDDYDEGFEYVDDCAI